MLRVIHHLAATPEEVTAWLDSLVGSRLPTGDTLFGTVRSLQHWTITIIPVPMGRMMMVVALVVVE